MLTIGMWDWCDSFHCKIVVPIYSVGHPTLLEVLKLGDFRLNFRNDLSRQVFSRNNDVRHGIPPQDMEQIGSRSKEFMNERRGAGDNRVD